MHDSGISIWSSSGCPWLVNGVLITGAGIWEVMNRPRIHQWCYFTWHANVWWERFSPRLARSIATSSLQSVNPDIQFLRTRSTMPPKKMTMGLIVATVASFLNHLAKSGREEVLRVLEQRALM